MNAHAHVRSAAKTVKALLSAVVIQAVSDLCLPVTDEEAECECNILPDARTALAFLFHPAGVLPHFCGWLDICPDAVRRHLIAQARCPISKWTVSPFGTRKEDIARAQQDNLRHRLQWYLVELANGHAPHPEQEHWFEQNQRSVSYRTP